MRTLRDETEFLYNGGRVFNLGGIGSAVSDALVRSCDGFTLEQMHVTRIPKSTRTPNEALEMCGLTAEQIVQRVMQVLQVA
ncbi:MAG: hypothetical protein AAGB51_10455 [Planctomycetota bacterium]